MSVRYWTLFFENPSCYMPCICSAYNGETHEGDGTDLPREQMVVSFFYVKHTKTWTLTDHWLWRFEWKIFYWVRRKA